MTKILGKKIKKQKITFCIFSCIIINLILLLQINQPYYYPCKDCNNIIKDPITPLMLSSKLISYEWNTTWGSTIEDSGWGVIIDSSDNVYLAGRTYNFGEGETDMVLVKYGGSGKQFWNRTWGGSSYDSCWGMAIDSLNNIYLAGDTWSFGEGNDDILLVKYDSSGVQQWNRTWGYGGRDLDGRVAVDSLNNVYLIGTTSITGSGSWDTVLIKYDSSGEQQWNRTWGGSYDERVNGVAVDSLNNIYVTGYLDKPSAGLDDIILLKYDSYGELKWSHTWDSGHNDCGEGIVVDSLNNVYIVGYSYNSTWGGYNIVLVKFDSSGGFKWTRTWGGVNGDYGYGITVDSSDNIYLTGYTESFGEGDSDIVLVKYNPSGEQQYNFTFGGSNADIGQEVTVDSLGDIYLGGYTHSFGAGGSDMILIKYGYSIPVIEILSPEYNELFGDIPPYYSLSIYEPELDELWYSLDGGLTNYTTLNTEGFINETAWEECSNGTVTIRFYVNDTLGNFAFKDILVHKDIEAPQIYINNPTPDQYHGLSPPFYDLSIIEGNLNFLWYTLDDGLSNYTITSKTGLINDNEWESKLNGSVTIKFYASDIFGRVNSAEVKIYKDTITPVSNIDFISYKEINIVNKSTIFTLNANDERGSGISIIRYRINNSAWIDYTTPFDLSTYNYGYYSISYQAIDNVGNIEEEHIIIVKLTKISTEKESVIFSYNLLILLSVSIISISYILKKKSKY